MGGDRDRQAQKTCSLGHEPKQIPADESRPVSDTVIVSTISRLISQAGVFGFLVFFGCAVFYFSADEEQKREFVDQYFLFRNAGDNPFPFAVVVLFLLLMLGMTIFVSRVRINGLKREIERLKDFNNELKRLLRKSD